jgi:hypothetical protein
LERTNGFTEHIGEELIMEAIKPKRQIKWGQLGDGAFALTVGLTCAGADIYNNVVFTVDKSTAMAVIFVAAGFGLALLPGLARGGWRDFQVWAIVAICGGLCLLAGYKNHMTSQRNHDLLEAGITERYNQAQAAIKAAEDDYRVAKAAEEAIAETMGSAELKVIVDAKGETIKSECAVRGPKCRKAEDDREAYAKRLGDAKAKEAAQARMSDALARMEREKAAAPAQAKAASASAEEEQIMAVLLLLFTVIGATLTHRGQHLIKASFVTIPEPKAKRESAPKPVAKPVAPIEATDGLKEFIGQAVTATEGEPTTSAKDAYAAMCSWWAVRQAGKPCPKEKAFGDAMTVAGIKRKKVKGRIHYQAKLEKQHLLVVRAA